jgi:hypothetical protein
MREDLTMINNNKRRKIRIFMIINEMKDLISRLLVKEDAQEENKSLILF